MFYYYLPSFLYKYRSLYNEEGRLVTVIGIPFWWKWADSVKLLPGFHLRKG